jgi:hypothetical protein
MRCLLLLTLASCCEQPYLLDIPAGVETEFPAETERAIEWWNQQVEGVKFFEMGGAITVNINSRCTVLDDRLGECGTAMFGCAIGYAEIGVCLSDEPLLGRHLRLILMHELGHAIGLDHSPDKRSVMYDTMTGLEPTLTVYEHELLKSIYSS